VFNTLIRRRNAAENAFAGVDVYLTMRRDLIPNLVAMALNFHLSAFLVAADEARAVCRQR
jgi:hypothetical protein